MRISYSTFQANGLRMEVHMYEVKRIEILHSSSGETVTCTLFTDNGEVNVRRNGTVGHSQDHYDTFVNELIAAWRHGKCCYSYSITLKSGIGPLIWDAP